MAPWSEACIPPEDPDTVGPDSAATVGAVWFWLPLFGLDEFECCGADEPPDVLVPDPLPPLLPPPLPPPPDVLEEPLELELELEWLCFELDDVWRLLLAASRLCAAAAFALRLASSFAAITGSVETRLAAVDAVLMLGWLLPHAARPNMGRKKIVATAALVSTGRPGLSARFPISAKRSAASSHALTVLKPEYPASPCLKPPGNLERALEEPPDLELRPQRHKLDIGSRKEVPTALNS